MNGDTVLSRINGLRVVDSDDKDIVKCDSCWTTIGEGDVVRVFFSNRVLGIDGTGLSLIRIQCSSCNVYGLKYSAVDFGEALVQAVYTDENRIINPQVLDVSKTDEGIPYNPIELLAELLGFPEQYIYEEFLPSEKLMAPQDIVYYLVESDVNPGAVIDEDTGEITAKDIHKSKVFNSQFMEYEQAFAEVEDGDYHWAAER